MFKQKPITVDTESHRWRNKSLEPISKRKEREGRGKNQSNSIMSKIMDSLFLHIYVTDLKSNKIIFMNHFVKERIGDAIGQICWQALHHGLDGPCTGCTSSHLFKNDKPNGVYIWESETFIPGRCYQFVNQAIRWTDGRMVRLSVGADITKLKKAERKLKTTFKDLKKTHDQLIQSEKLASMGLLAEGITHEIKNPVNFIYSALGPLKRNLLSLFIFLDRYLEVEKRNPGDIKDFFRQMNQVKSQIDLSEVYRDIKDLMGIIAEGTERVISIVQDMQVSRDNMDAIKNIDINQCLDSTISLVFSQRKEGIRVLRHYMDDTTITCNPVQIKQVLLNILTNAIHAIGNKGIIRIETYKDLEDIYLTISDNGCGIPNDLLGRVFDPFYTSKKGGTGIGLYIVHEIIKKHHGSVKVFSEVDLGTVVTIRLPIR
ncbi:MAG: hypothetical protein IEMM0008_1110 [bacterium]|nr:MAG: hypothetical protein IEMM0008_1110 [bacterium]